VFHEIRTNSIGASQKRRYTFVAKRMGMFLNQPSCEGSH
jgi:hypothetical protein